MEVVSPFISILTIITGSVTMFFALKSQVEKLSVVVNNNTDEIKALRKILESVSRNNDSEINVLKTRFDDMTKKIKSINHRLSELETNGCGLKK